MSLISHTAAGQALGYFYQLERALSSIALSPTGSTVGIETEDDIVVKLTNGEEIHEQDKSSTTSYPFSPRSSDFWKTLNIWLEAIKEKEIDPETTTFQMVTNKTASSSLAKEMAVAADETTIAACVLKIRDEGKAIETAIKPLVNKVLAYSDKELATLIKKIKYKDGTDTYSRSALISDLQIVEDDPAIADRIIDTLTGWLFNEVVESWRAKLPAIIERDALVRVKNNLIISINETLINDKIFSMAEINSFDELHHQESMFVKQMDLVDCTPDEIIEAIHDYLHSIAKKTGIATKGYVTHTEMEDMEEELVKRWKTIFRSQKILHKSTHDAAEIGQLIFLATLDHNATLGRFKMQNFFLTRGSYHSLANDMKLGWHPDYKVLLIQKTQTTKSTA